jgi:hypothetical protein
LASINLGPRVQPGPLVLPEPPQAPASGLSELGAGVADAGKALEEITLKENEKEARSQATKGLADLQAFVNQRLYDPQAGAISLVGEKAIAAHATLPKELEDKSTELRGGLAAGRAQELYEAKAREILLRAGVTLDKHAGQQVRVVRAANVDALVKTSGDTITSDPDQADALVQSVEETVRSQALSGPMADYAAKEWKQDARTKQVMGYLNAGRLDDAKAAFLRHEAEFGAAAPAVRDHILTFDRGVQAEQNAARWVDEFRTDTGAVNEGLAKKKLNTITDPKLRIATEKALDARLQNERAAWDANVKHLFAIGGAHLNSTRRNDQQVIDALNALVPWSKEALSGPDLATQLVNRESVWTRRNRASHSEATRIQNEIDARAMFMFLQKPEQVRSDKDALDVDRTFSEMGTSPKMLEHLKAEQNLLKEKIDRRTGMSETEFRQMVQGKLGKRYSAASPEARRAMDARMNLRYQALAKDGDPHLREAEASADALAKQVHLNRNWARDFEGSALELDLLYPNAKPEDVTPLDTPIPQADGGAATQVPPAAGAAKTIKSYKFDPSGARRRIPVYDDGTVGMAEDF